MLSLLKKNLFKVIILEAWLDPVKTDTDGAFWPNLKSLNKYGVPTVKAGLLN